jgi:alanyl-tRNA synthetase
MGLERALCVLNGKSSVYETDLFENAIQVISELTGKTYGENEEVTKSFRVLLDHTRTATFMLGDEKGIVPSNTDQGYILRRIIRRAARHGRKIGIEGTFLAELSKTVISGSKDGYPELEEKKEFIFNVLTQEENKFNKTIDQGLGILSDLEESLKKEGLSELSGEEAFKLYDTYGFPLDLTKEILEEKGYTVDEEGFQASMEKQRETARAARKVTNYMGADATVYDEIDPAITSEFDGYDKLKMAFYGIFAVKMLRHRQYTNHTEDINEEINQKTDSLLCLCFLRPLHAQHHHQRLPGGCTADRRLWPESGAVDLCR